MLAKKVSQKILSESLKFLNKHSQRSIQSLVMSLMEEGCQLTLTSLGRHLRGKSTVKTKINRVNDFLNNGIVYGQIGAIYASIVRRLFKPFSTMVIGVDWSESSSEDYCLLTASLLYQGRSIPLYQETHDACKEENAEVHSNFLSQLKTVIPEHRRVIIVTDAGFKTPWFLEVQKQGWDFVGRVRGHIQCQIATSSEWLATHQLYTKAEGKPKYLGQGWLSKTSTTQTRGHFYLYKERLKGRKKSKPKGKSLFPDTERRYSKMNVDPWLIFTSLSEEQLKAQNIIYIYRKRMQIEQNFRDSKNQRWGLGMRNSRTKGVERISLLCLIGNLATLLLWLIGFTAERKNYHFSFQANTVKTQRVLSFFILAKQILFHQRYKISLREIEESLKRIAMDYELKVLYA